jgi:hypothetical protein
MYSFGTFEQVSSENFDVPFGQATVNAFWSNESL